MNGYLRWMDKAGKSWSTDPNDRAYYDIDKQAYCINIERDGKIVLPPKSVSINLSDDLKKTADQADQILEGVKRGLRDFYAGRR